MTTINCHQLSALVEWKIYNEYIIIGGKVLLGEIINNRGEDYLPHVENREQEKEDEIEYGKKKKMLCW